MRIIAFKEVNDIQGQQVEDHVLCEAAQKLRAALSGLGTVARLGGDEFAMILHAAGREWIKRQHNYTAQGINLIGKKMGTFPCPS